MRGERPAMPRRRRGAPAGPRRLDDDGDPPTRVRTTSRNLEGAWCATRRAWWRPGRACDRSNRDAEVVVVALRAARLGDAEGLRRRRRRYGPPRWRPTTAGEILVAAGTVGTAARRRRDPRVDRALAHRGVAGHDAASRPRPSVRRTSTATRSPPAAGRRSTSAGACTARSNQRTEVISTKPAGAAVRRGTPTPIADRQRDARARRRDPLPPARARPDRNADARPPRPAPARRTVARSPTSPRSRAASKCVRGRKLTVRFKKPPKGYVGQDGHGQGQRQEGRDGQGQGSSRSRCTCASCPKGTFTVTVTITLTKGKGLTERRRYTACKYAAASSDGWTRSSSRT